MKGSIGVTDNNWFAFLSKLPDIDEVNFWQPSGDTHFQALSPGEPFLFKLHSPHNYIVGGGFFAHYSRLPVSLAWDVFGEKNGAKRVGVRSCFLPFPLNTKVRPHRLTKEQRGDEKALIQD